MTKVFTTSREVRSFLLGCDPFCIPPFVTTISEFENKLLLYPNKVAISPQMRLMLMKKACEVVPIEILGFDKDFLYYLKTRDFLFRFFDELAGECVAVEDLSRGDTYAFFDDHLRILTQLRQEYTSLLDQYGFVDPMTRSSGYELNLPYILGCGEIELFVQGYLTTFEWEILTKVAKIVPVKLFVTLSRYYPKLISLVNSFGFEGEDGQRVEIDLSAQKVRSLGVLPPLESVSSDFFPVTSRLLQVGMVKEIIYEWMTTQGMDPEAIVVVTPDEGFATILKEWDDDGLFNLAMGVEGLEVVTVMQEYAKGCEEKREAFWYEEERFETFKTRLLPFEEKITDHTMHQEWNKKVFELSLLVDRMEGKGVVRELFYLFLEMVQAITRDDVRGGKVKVMGVLETRGMAFEGVIVVDFNESVVPKPSVKDSFLNSYVRQEVGLPTRSDRENLQKLYYDHLFRKTSRVAIGYVANETSFRSRFVDELFGRGGDEGENATKNRGCSVNLFDLQGLKSPLLGRVDTQGMVEKTFQSASSLTTYFLCPRKYYWRYVKKLAPSSKDTTDAMTLGNIIHEVMAKWGTHEPHLSSKDALSLFIKGELEQRLKDTPLWEVEKVVWFDRLMAWGEVWLERKKEGISCMGVEKEGRVSYRGVELEGRCDWVDRLPDGSIEIIDFKTSTIDEKDFEPHTMKSFQTVVYYLLGKEWGEVKEVSLVGLTQNVRIADRYIQEKIGELDRVIDEIAMPSNTYEMCEEKWSASRCHWCPYTLLCGRG